MPFVRDPFVDHRPDNSFTLIVIEDRRRAQKIRASAAAASAPWPKGAGGTEELCAFAIRLGVRLADQPQELAHLGCAVILLRLSRRRLGWEPPLPALPHVG